MSTRKNGDIGLGARLKTARGSKGLSLRGLAQRTGFSASFLSQVELGQASPSLASLESIAQALGASLAELLSEPQMGNGPVVRRAGEAPLRSEWSRATLHSLIPAAASSGLEVYLLCLEPQGRSGESSAKGGGERLAFCVRGTLTFVLDGQRQVLRAGDSIFFEAGRTTSWENHSRRAAEVLLVSARTPP